MTQEQIIEAVEKMTVLELNELVKAIEEKWGVSAAAVAVAAPGAAAGGEEQTSFNVELTDGGAQKIAVIKVVKEVLGLGLKEAKESGGRASGVVRVGRKRAEADALKAKHEEAGAEVILK